MTIRTYRPAVQVLLKKNIGRRSLNGQTAVSTRYAGLDREIDLTPHLGEAGSVRVTKSVRQPAGGFSVVLADKMFQGKTTAQMESVYGLVEPMDVVEIRMSGQPHLYAGGNLPIVMRGLVSQINRSEAIGPDGKPARSITIMGQDYGKILQIMQVVYLAAYPLGQQLLSYFKLFANYGIEFGENRPAGEFVTEVLNKVVNPFIADMSKAATSQDASLTSPLVAIKPWVSVTDGVVSPFGANAWNGGSIYELLHYFGDVGNWNELFIEDREDAPYLVYRPNPFLDLEGKPITPVAEPYAAPIFDLFADDVTGIDVTRSDADVANYYWVDAPRYQLNGSPILRLEAARSGDEKNFLLADYLNSSPLLYGIRRLEAQTEQGERYDGAPKEKLAAAEDLGFQFITDRRNTLIQQNKDNVVLEQGSIRMRGQEDLKAGSHIRLTRGTLQPLYYAVSVDHEYRPFGGFLTTASVERGTGFVERVKRAAGQQSPYLEEIKGGGAYG